MIVNTLLAFRYHRKQEINLEDFLEHVVAGLGGGGGVGFLIQ